MAVFCLRPGFVSRRNGSSSLQASAYRGGRCMRDLRSGEVYDHSDREDVLHSESFLPDAQIFNPEMLWALDSERLWNAVEAHARRKDALLAREWIGALPDELSGEEHRDIARTFGKDLANRFGGAVEVFVHPPRDHSDERNFHVHVLMTTHQVTPEGFGRLTDLELSGAYRHQLGVPGSSRQDYQWVREHWADLLNSALERAGVAERVDHRSLKTQGVDREPAPTIPDRIRYAERNTGHSLEVGDAIRAQHQERVEAREKGPEVLAQVVERQKQEGRQRAQQLREAQQNQPQTLRWGQMTDEQHKEVRRQRHAVQRTLEKGTPKEERRRAASREASRRYRRRHPRAAQESVMRWREAHPDAWAAYQRSYYRRHAQLLAERSRDRRAAHLEERRQRDRERYRRKQFEKRKARYQSPSAQQSAALWKARRLGPLDHGVSPTSEERRRAAERREALERQEKSRHRDLDLSL